MSRYEHEVIKKIREIADGRRHYDGADGYNCFDALGDIREICDKALDFQRQTRDVREEAKRTLKANWGIG